MKIQDEHLYHGAVLNQIAEHERFTAINALTVFGNPVKSAFRVNDDTAVYLKYARKPHGSYDEYLFTFHQSNLEEIANISQVGNNLHLALVCVQDREVCCIPYSVLVALVEKRIELHGGNEDQYTLLVNLPKNKSFRVSMNAPRVKGRYVDTPITIPRNACPDALFRR